MRKKPELLVPAGGEKQFIAAVENGADAIYLGGNFFNARINADNFDESKMQVAIDFAHRRGVKVFVTMNTLVRDDELAEALSYAKFLYEAGADALIIQDLGLGSIIRQNLPDFELHLSTQASVCDVESLAVAKKLGYKRVVLARELGLEEIRTLCDSGHCDIEVFVHGAMCICYSGQCQLSRFYGGRSGNRGQCAQPCRLPYKSYKLVNGEYELIKDAAPHPLSPRDMCQIDNIGELIDAGVLSFKIEGRMKSPEYVAVVTKIYRKYIDEYLEKGSYVVSREDRDALLQIFNRGEFTEGYMYGDPKERLMSETIPKNQGILAGEVVAYNRNTKLVNVKLFKDIAMHDGIEVHAVDSRDGSSVHPGGIVTYCKDLGNGVVQLGDFAGRINKGDYVYRTSSRAQLDEARVTFEGKSLEDGECKWIRKLPVDCKLMCYGDKLTLSVQAGSVRASVEAGPFKYSEDRATPYDRYQTSLLKTGNTPFEVRNIRFDGDFNIVVKASEINALRREALEELGKNLCFRRVDIGDGSFCPPSGQKEPSLVSTTVSTLGELKEGCTAGYQLNAYNSETVRVLKELGAKEVIPSLEAVDYNIDKNPYPLMLSKHIWSADRFVSPMGHDLTVIREDGVCKLVATEKMR